MAKQDIREVEHQINRAVKAASLFANHEVTRSLDMATLLVSEVRVFVKHGKDLDYRNQLIERLLDFIDHNFE